MVAAILLHYVIDAPLPTRGTFGDPGSNSGADNIFFLLFECFSFFPTCLVLFFHMLLLHKLLFYLVCMVASCNNRQKKTTNTNASLYSYILLLALSWHQESSLLKR